jgi:beta-galactosidase
MKNFVLVAATTLVCLAPLGCRTGSGHREVINLNGTWQVAAGKLDKMPTAFDRTVRVPGLLDMATPAFKAPGSTLTPAQRGRPWERAERSDPLREAFWYRRTFKVKSPEATVAMLKVHKARFGMQVFVNGAKVGAHNYNFTPGWFNIKPFIKTDGSENELVIRVGASLAQAPKSVCDGWDYQKSRYIPGIYDSVELIVSKTPHVVNVQTAPDIATGSVRVVAEIGNAGGAIRGIMVTATVREAKSGLLVGGAVAGIDRMHPGVSTKSHLAVNIENPHLWTPEDPFLYELTVDTGADTYKTRFAMRSFKSDPKSGRMLLNGKPYYLRGSNVCIFRFFEDAQRGGKPWDRDWVRKLHRKFKGMNWNSLRYYMGFPPEMWYDIADEEGILIQDEYPISYGAWNSGTIKGWPDDITNGDLAAEFTSWMRERWNHPSVVIWDAQNKTPNDTIISQTIAKVRNLDLSDRPWDNGLGAPQAKTDPSEYHPYRCGPKFKGRFGLSIYEEESGVPDGGPKKGAHPPYIINEYGWLWLNRDGSPTELSKPVYHSVLGPGASRAQISDYYARMLAAKTEFWRCKRKSAGIMHFCGLGYSRKLGLTSDSFSDIETLAFNPDFEKYVRDSFAPVGVAIDMWKERIDPGSELTVPVVVINDLGSDWSGTVTIRMLEDGETVVTGEQKVTAKAYGSAKAHFKIQFPDELASHELIAEINGADGKPVRSYRKVRIGGSRRAVIGGLLKNGGMESGTIGQVGKGETKIDAWRLWGTNGWYHADKTQVIGSRAVKFWSGDSGAFQSFNARAGQKYKFSVKVLNSADENDALKLWKGYLRAEFNSAAGKVIGGKVLDLYDPKTTKTPLETWHTLSGVITAPRGTATGTIVLGLKDGKSGAAGSLDFDSASIEKINASKKKPKK